MVLDKWTYFQIHRNYLSVQDTIWRARVHALKRGHKAVKAQPCLFLQRMLTPSAFLYSCAVLNYHCKGKAAIPEGSWLGEKWQKKLEYPTDCKHLSSCRLLTPLCLQLGMAFTLIRAGQKLAQPLTMTSWTQRDDYLCSRCPSHGWQFSLVKKSCCCCCLFCFKEQQIQSRR